MSNTEMNRQIVQEGLEEKKTARLQRMNDAAHDAAERQLRATINQRTQERRAVIEAAEAEERRQEERRRQRAAVRSQEAADRAQEEKAVEQTLQLTVRVFVSLLYAALVTFGFIHEVISTGVAFYAIGLSVIYCIVTFGQYVTRAARERRAA